MNQEKLIEHVKQYRSIYDLDDKYYADNDKKRQVWREIGKKLNIPGKLNFIVCFYLICLRKRFLILWSVFLRKV